MSSDNHIHTPFCPHGSADTIEEYIQAGLRAGLKEMTFTEHAPLPIEDTVPEKNSAMKRSDVPEYLSTVHDLSVKYADMIHINAGFEVDYIEGKEALTLEFLKLYPETIPHSILSVHFIQTEPEDYFCIDYDPDSFIQKGQELGYETLYRLYEKTMQKALSLPYGELTPKKIGHLNLIHKFQKRYSVADPIDWKLLLRMAKHNDYRLDYNFSGIDKPHYGKTYPDNEMMTYAKSIGAAFETGSDAHAAHEIGRYFTLSNAC